MKFMQILLVFLIGAPSLAWGQTLTSGHTKPFEIRILSDEKGVIKEEKLSLTPQTFCFKEAYYCSMEEGKCICDLHRCNNPSPEKEYWIEITGILSETDCGLPHPLHNMTGLCLCAYNKSNPCEDCNPPYSED